MRKVRIKVKDQYIHGILENPNSRKLVILVHGFTGYMQGPANIFIKLSKELQKNDYAVLRFNFLGTPPSEGDFKKMTFDKQVNEFKAVLKYAKTQGYEEIAVLGESMGGAVVVSGYEESLKAVILWYPVFDFFDSAFSGFLTKKNKMNLKEKGYVKDRGSHFQIGKEFVENISSINIYKDIEEVQSPILFLHGDNDSDVPYQQSEKAFELARDPKEMKIIKGADHCFENEQEEVIKLTVQFLKRYFNFIC